MIFEELIQRASSHVSLFNNVLESNTVYAFSINDEKSAVN